MFSLVKNGFKQSVICSKEAFDALLNDTTVIDNCANIKRLVENIPADASEATLKANKELISQFKSGSREKGIKNLPGFCFHAWFKDGVRSNDSAIASGLCSIDLDHVPSPRDFFLMLKDKAMEQQLALAFITPSTQGLKLVFPVPEGAHDMEEAQNMIVEALGVAAYFDDATVDMARLAFAVPSDYVLYRNDDILFKERTMPENFGREMTSCTDFVGQLQPEIIPEQKAGERYVDGICMSELIQYLSMKHTGMAEPPLHQRNNTLYKTAKVMRVACQDDIELLFEVMPEWGMSTSEWNATIRSACRGSITISARKEFEEMMVDITRRKAVENGDTVWQLPAPPKNLPPVFREYAHITPAELLPAQLLSLLPILGFYGTMGKANYSAPGERPRWRTGSFIVVVSAPFASGKDVITQTYNELTANLREMEQPLLKQLNKYNKTKKEEDKPMFPIRLMPERLSMTSLSVMLENAGNQHLLQFTPEIDTMRSNNGSGAFNDLSTVHRKSTDNDLLGQIFQSGESHCCNVPVYLNQLILAQPERLESYFTETNVVNGLVSRIIFIELPDNTGRRKLNVKEMSDFEKANVNRVLSELSKIGKVVEPAKYDENGEMIKAAVMERVEFKIPRTRKALERWGLGHQDNYLKSMDNPAEDRFFRRAAQMGFHAGLVAYMCNGCKETKEVVDFALWVAEYMLQSLLLHFGAIYNELHRKRENNRTDKIVKMVSVNKFKLLDALPDKFGVEEMRDISLRNGRSMSNPYNYIKRWKDVGFITEVPTNTQVKVWQKVVPVAC